ncbi:MAG: hypothetical protein SGJ27_12280 [Candidatus Melainabacteria bacterium]|nr:hypothetical protein [Candidatus Melainabacteria bacterium]
MHRSRLFNSKIKLSKTSCLNLLLSMQFLLSSFYLPLPAMADELPANPAATTSVAPATTRSDADQGADEAPSGWESAANEFIRSENKALSEKTVESAATPATETKTSETTATEINATEINATETKAAETNATETKATETKAAETKAAETKATETKATETKATEINATETKAAEVKAPSVTEEKQTSLFEVETSKEPTTTKTDDVATKTIDTDASKAVTTDAAAAVTDTTTVVETKTEAAPNSAATTEASTTDATTTTVTTVDTTKSDNDGKQLADTTGATSERKESTGNKDGIGGFVGEGLDGGVALLEQGFVEQGVRETLGEVIVIDNDEAVEVEETIAYEELPTDEGKTKIKSGAQFPVVMSSQLNSKNNKKGDSLQARLKYDLKIGDRIVAKKGAMVTGHIHYNLPARSVMHSMVTPKRWYKNSGVLGITFDEIVNDKKEHIALNARPARKARIIRNKAEGRELGVNDVGEITGPWGQQLKYKAIRIGLNFALAPAGVFSFGAMPVALGVIGAANPSFAFMKPVGTNVRHRRIKGFAWGFLSGIPGSWLIEDTVTKGQEAIVKPGDEFLVELKEEFTGEARSEATLMPGSAAKVRGQVLTDTKEKSKTKTKKK